MKAASLIKKQFLSRLWKKREGLFYVGMNPGKEKTHVMLCETAVTKRTENRQIFKGGRSMKAVIYFTEIPPQYEHKNMGHMTGEKLLEEALLKEYGRKLAFEPRAKGEHGKPFFTLQPKFIITSAIPESMWSVFLQERK